VNPKTYSIYKKCPYELGYFYNGYESLYRLQETHNHIHQPDSSFYCEEVFRSESYEECLLKKKELDEEKK
jgi:hypothetical protein